MNEHRRITTALDAETIALVEEVARKRGLSSDAYAAEAIRRVVESDADFDAFVQVGLNEAARGEVVPHEEVMAELDAMIAKHRAR
jgi:predicted transcriptional regulator